MDYLMRRGLEPGHRVLDFGCGTMRTGVWLARYLAAGNYFGIDAHRPSLETAARYEIPLHGLEEKCPRLLHDAEGRVDHFGTTFDYVLLLAVLIHLQTDVQHQVLNRIARVLAPGGRIVIWRVPPTLTEASLRGANELLVTHRELTRSRFGDFTLDWMELQRAAR
jgi:SAM-dependent methyltransferase